ncbi:hypothetical protein [Streptomyces sp. NPDC059063]|uniref:hypothetical protein n=1 Tax=unclassified Streptomyces TaxID=2593676 RepID=UPI0036AF4B29
MPGIDVCLGEVMALPGARGAALVDWTCGLALGSAGRPPHGRTDAAAAETADLARLSVEYGTFHPPAPDGRGTADGSVLLHVWLDRHAGNLAVARLRLQVVARRLVLE